MPGRSSIHSLLTGCAASQGDWSREARAAQSELGLSVALLPRVSPRAKRIVLRFKPAAGLEIVLPGRLRPTDFLQAVRSKREWIETQAAKLRASGVPLSSRDWLLPREIVLADWPERAPLRLVVGYREGPPHTLTVSQPEPGRLLVAGRTTDKLLAAGALAEAVTRLSRRPILLAMEQVSGETGMRAQKVRVARQRSRWGSCSAKGVVSLNYRLALLPFDLARYVMLHELCHLEHLHHGPAFWQLLDRIEPRSLLLDKKLGQAGSFLPGWVLAASTRPENGPTG